MTTNPDLAAELDQLRAAITDARHHLQHLATAHGGALTDCPAPRWLIPHTRRLAATITTGTARCCPHLGPAPSVAHAAVWDPGHLTCHRCTWRLVPDAGEDTTCDRCRRHTDLIYPGAFALGAVLLAFGLCHRCRNRPEHTLTGQGTRS